MFRNVGNFSFDAVCYINTAKASAVPAAACNFTLVEEDHTMLMRLMTSACAAAMVLTLSATPTFAQGQPLDSRTEFTFNQPVELPVSRCPQAPHSRFVDGTTVAK